jgi:hypothetical protein
MFKKNSNPSADIDDFYRVGFCVNAIFRHES